MCAGLCVGVFLSVCGSVHMSANASGSQKTSDILELTYQLISGELTYMGAGTQTMVPLEGQYSLLAVDVP